ncbi:hypothetical protein [Actinomadura fibrosa]|uniref:Uncharacterized protein n=1 Tax=Actinomadura fibrosa TaxID=111802 RepID=A0ABW2XNG7_9ACTN|nr:hypothetical protein [Actinomadura fibrosa]
MADSPPRSDAPGSAPGDDLDRQQAAEDGAPGGPVVATPEPWGGSPPWWSSAPGDGTGPHALPGGTGPHVLPDGTGPHVLPDGTGPHRLPGSANGTGPLRMPGPGPANGTGGHPLPNGTGPIPVMPGQDGAGTAARQGGRGRLPGLLLGAGIGACLLALLIAGVLVLRSGADRKAPAVSKASTKRIATAAIAGGLRKDGVTAPPASAAYPFVAAAVRAGGIPAAKDGTAVYTDQPTGEVNVLFMGGTGQVGDPAEFLRKIRPTTFVTGQNADAGAGGGRALCGTFAVLADVHLYCAWATKDSYGIVASNVSTPGEPVPLMADLMRRVRQDVEKPRR